MLFHTCQHWSQLSALEGAERRHSWLLQAMARWRSVCVQLVEAQLVQYVTCVSGKIQPNTCSILTPTQPIMTPSPAVCVKTHSHTKPRRPLLVTTLCARVETTMLGRLSVCISWQRMTMEHRCTCKQRLPRQKSCTNTSRPRRTSYRSAYVLVRNAVTVCRQHQYMVGWSTYLFTIWQNMYLCLRPCAAWNFCLCGC